jgi:hypothetical protein
MGMIAVKKSRKSPAIPSVMSKQRIRRVLSHPAFALTGAILFAAATMALLRGGMAAEARLAAADDPVKISDQALDNVFNRDVAEREICSALATGDTDLAQSFLGLAVDRGVVVNAALTESAKEAHEKAASLPSTAGRFVQGLWTGEPVDLASLAGTHSAISLCLAIFATVRARVCAI